MLKVLTKGCEPYRGTRFSAALDLSSSEDVIIEPNSTAIVGLGVCVDVTDDNIATHAKTGKWDLAVGKYIDSHGNERDKYDKFISIFRLGFMLTHYLELHPRSSLRAKGLVSNTGVIDLDFVPSCKVGYPIDVDSCKVFIPAREDAIMENKCENCKHFNQNEIKIIIYNPRTTMYQIKKGDRIAQILLKEHCSYHFNVDNDTERTRDGGFGSTGGVK